MMCINAAFTLYATNQLPEIPVQRCVGVRIETEEAGFGGMHLAEAVGGNPISAECSFRKTEG